MTKIVATLSKPVQIGENEFKQVYTSKVFDYSTTIQELFDWGKEQGLTDPAINDFQLSTLS